MAAVEKITSYYTDILMPATLNAGIITGWTLNSSIPDCLKKHGVAFLADGVDISDDSYASLMSTMRDFNWSTCLFTNFNREHQTTFLNKSTAKRYVTRHEQDLSRLKEWNSLNKKSTNYSLIVTLCTIIFS